MVLVTVRTCSDQLAGSGYGQWPLPMIQELIVGPFRQCAFT
jgi:hypothetical protein